MFLRELVLLFGGLEGVAHEEGDGHGADAAWDGSDGGAFGGDFGEIHVAGEAVAVFRGGVFDAVDADVDDDGARFDPIGFDHFGATDGGDDDVGAAANGGEVVRTGVGDGDGGVNAFCHEKECHGLADDHGATDDDGFCASGFDACFLEEEEAACGGAGDEAGGVFEGELGDVFGVEAVHVFAWVDGAHDFFFVDVLGWRRLDEDAVDGGIGVEFGDDFEEFGLGGFGGEGDFTRVEAEFGTGADF